MHECSGDGGKHAARPNDFHCGSDDSGRGGAAPNARRLLRDYVVVVVCRCGWLGVVVRALLCDGFLLWWVGEEDSSEIEIGSRG